MDAAEKNKLIAERDDHARSGRMEAAWTIDERLVAECPDDMNMRRRAAWTCYATRRPEAAEAHLREVKDRYERAQRNSKAKADEMVDTVLKTVLPSWTHAQDKSTDRLYRGLMSRWQIDDVPNWINHQPILHATGDIVDFGEIGKFLVGNDTHVIQKRLFRGLPWELPIVVLLMELAGRCKKTSVITDIGANIGTMTVPLAKAFKGDVFSFEPVDNTFADLRANRELNELTNVRARHVALSSKKGYGHMANVGLADPGVASLEVSGSGHTVISTLDDELDNRPLALIKIDVEGHEIEAFSGAMSSIETHRPLILCELLDGSGGGTARFLADLGYKKIRVYRSDWLFYQ